MNIKDVRKLRKDDEVYWNDPDNGLCSKTIKIATVEVRLPCYTVIITGDDGSYLECFASELS
jgi:hypothetical protein